MVLPEMAGILHPFPIGGKFSDPFHLICTLHVKQIGQKVAQRQRVVKRQDLQSGARYTKRFLFTIRSAVLIYRFNPTSRNQRSEDAMRQMFGKFVSLFGCLFLIGISAAESIGGPGIGLSKGQTIYVPSYSHVYHTDRERPYYLTATLCIRNADPALPINIVSVEYFDSDGNLLKSYVDKTVTIAPMASTYYSVKESDKAGGLGAKFLVKWVSDSMANEPIVECVMIGTSGQQGISFLSTGRVIRDNK